jgi:GT2 family glycosyltransferase
VVTFNGMQWIKHCLDSLLLSSCPLHIVVIDNCSNDGTPAFIKKHYATIQLIEPGKNLGFGQANNIGFNIAIAEKADLVFLLNQDAWIETNTIEQLVRAQVENPGYGIISPLHFDGEGIELDRYFLEYLLKSCAHEFIQSKNDWPANQLVNTGFVNAAAWLITMDCLKKTGGFDPVFFHYGEDQNYAQRALYWGFKIGVHPTARICHDRALRIAGTPTDIKTILKKDWMNLLIHACNIQQPGFFTLLARRMLRYTGQAFGSLFLMRRDLIFYNLSMTGNIISFLLRIRKSRFVTSRPGSSPYLQMVRHGAKFIDEC